MLRSIHLACALLSGVGSFAAHIIGGEMYYDHLDGDDYRITLKVYRDCAPGQTPLDGLAPIAVFSGDGTFIERMLVPLGSSQIIPAVLGDPCLSVPPSICLQVGVYTQVFTLPAGPLGYTIAYQACCRTLSLVNIIAPGDQGITCMVGIPPTPDQVNSSPRFNAPPSSALCLDRSMVFDLSATDPDGDSLVYALTTPFKGGGPLDPSPDPPVPPPYVPLQWAPPYSEGYPMDSDPPLDVDPATGVLTVHPSQVASYTVAVVVKEYRQGMLLSEVRRDLRFDVSACFELDALFTAVPPSPQPSATVVGLQDQTWLNGFPVVAWSWSVDGVHMPWSGPGPVWEDAPPGTHTIRLDVTTAAGCMDSYELPYTITVGEVSFPNIFSPNGDGDNDRFEIPNAQYRRNRLQVYDRWGVLVYGADNYRNQWDAAGLPEGTYFYRVQFPDEHREHTGPVTLVR